MSKSVSTELARVKKLFAEGKYEEALQLVKDIEQNINLTSEETLRVLRIKGGIYNILGDSEISFKLIEELYQKSQEMKMPLFSLDALFYKENILYTQQKFEEVFKILEQHEKLFKSIPRDNSLEFQEREAGLLLWKAGREHHNGNLDLALEYQKKSLNLFEQADPHSINIPIILGTSRSYVYLSKGELDLALECDEKALSLLPKRESFNSIMIIKSQIYRNMGMVYYQKGDLNRSLEYHITCFELLEKTKDPMWMNASYLNIIDILLVKKDFNQAQNYLQQLKQFNEEYKSRFGYLTYQLASAIILKSSPRLRDIVKAEEILKKIVEDNLGDISLSLIFPYALIGLCDLYFEEFRLTNQMEILDDINPLIDFLQRGAKYSNSFSALALVKLLQAKLALLQINLVDARKLITEAQKIADEHGLQLLAGAISREHDRLLEELKLWESFKKTQASVSERLKLASIDEVLERLQGRRAVEPLQSSDEQPVLLLILAGSGILLFSYPFSNEWKRNDDLFGSFLSAFSTFSDEFFSQGLDRAKFGEETILLQPAGTLSICYLFRGQTYFAQQKLVEFVETVQKDPVIWQTLEKFEKSSQVAELKDLPKMETVLTGIFLS